jgi:hypothetical protein
MPLLSITEGWTGILGPFTLRVDGLPLSLTGFTVTLSLRNPAGLTVQPGGIVTVTPDQTAFKGQLTYAPVATDFVFIPGTYGLTQIYKMHWKVVDGASRVVYFPSGAPDDIEVYRA